METRTTGCSTLWPTRRVTKTITIISKAPIRISSAVFLPTAARNGLPPPEKPNRTFFNYMREATADFWAGETIARLFPGSSPEELIEHAKSATVERCDDGADDDHPPGKYRINMIGRNPSLLGRIGCEGTPPDQPLCNLAGAAASGSSGQRQSQPQSQSQSQSEEPTPARVPDRNETLADEVRSGNPERGSEPNPVFFDAAEELIDRLTPRQAFAFISAIPNRAARRAFQGIYEARYIVDPAVLRDTIYDPKRETGLREAALREISNRLKSGSVGLIADTFGMRPEHAAIFEGEITPGPSTRR